MCFYISKLYQYEILRMDCEFAKDFHGTIWFLDASNLWVRPNVEAIKASEIRSQKIRQINEDYRKKLFDDIAELENRKDKANVIRQLKDTMNTQYLKIREDAGINTILDNSDGSDYESE